MNGTIKSFRDLRVWQVSRELCVNIYKGTSKFPKDEQFGLTSQMRRAAVSIPSNIAEGFGRKSGKEKDQFYRHSLGSLFELDTQLALALRLNLIGSGLYTPLTIQLESCKAMLIKLLKVNNEKFVNR